MVVVHISRKLLHPFSEPKQIDIRQLKSGSSSICIACEDN